MSNKVIKCENVEVLTFMNDVRKAEVLEHPCMVLTMRIRDNIATVATDGVRHLTQANGLVKEHTTIMKAIAYLESKGYCIDNDNFYSV